MLNISMQDGETRVINLHPSFFLETKVSLVERCLSIAYGFGAKVYKIACLREGVPMFEKTNPGNEPVQLSVASVSDEVKAAEYKTKRGLRNEFKKAKFTQKWNFSTGMFTDLVTGKTSYSGVAA